MQKYTRRTALTALCALLLTACPSSTQPGGGQPTVTRQKPQAVVAIALGGGASKGFAHIGILKVLKQHNIPVKVVTDLVDLTLSTSGFIKGEKLQNYINHKVGNRPIQQFPIKFAAVATDFSTGKAVAFNRGNAGQAVRASAAIPNVFQPVVIAGRRYVDGGLTQPVPVTAARGQGANFVIAVDISAKPIAAPSKDFLSYLDQTLNIMSTSALNGELSKADVVIKPQVQSLGAVGGFDQKAQAIKIGEQAALAALPEIKRKLAAYRY